MKDGETISLREEKRVILKNSNKNNRYKKILIISLTLNILSLFIIVFLLFKLNSQKIKFEKEIYLLKREKEAIIETNSYYDIKDIKKYYNSSIKDNIDEKQVINIDKSELLDMCYKSRESYFDKRRIEQNKFVPGRKYIQWETKTIQSKLNYLIVHESPDYKSKIADKIKLHEYVYKILGKDICVPIIKIYKNTSEINFTELPNKFVLKCNHGAKMNIIVNNKTNLDYEDAKNKLDSWMERNFGLEGGEFQYINIEKRIFAEKFLQDNIEDYKIYCFHGVPKFIRVQKYNNEKKMKINNYFTLDWKLTDIETGRKGFYRDPDVVFSKPPNLDLMLSYARKLSFEFVFVRIDFYDFNGKVYLGEMTFSPSNVCFTLKNMEQAKYLGSLLDITKIKKYLFN